MTHSHDTATPDLSVESGEGIVMVACGQCQGIGCDFCDGFGHFNRPVRGDEPEEKGQGWITLGSGGILKGTRLRRVAEIWRDQGLGVVALPVVIPVGLLDVLRPIAEGAAPAPNPSPAAKGGEAEAVAIGSPEWCDEAERSEWAFMAKMLGEAIDYIRPANLSGLGVAKGIAEARAEKGWRTYATLATPLSQPAGAESATSWTRHDLAEGLATLNGEGLSDEYWEQADHLMAHLSYCASTASKTLSDHDRASINALASMTDEDEIEGAALASDPAPAGEAEDPNLWHFWNEKARWLAVKLANAERERDDARKALDALTEALTPSGGTKAEYIGEFFEEVEFPNPEYDEDDEESEDGETILRRVPVQWETVKEIMNAIKVRAARSASREGASE